MPPEYALQAIHLLRETNFLMPEDSLRNKGLIPKKPRKLCDSRFLKKWKKKRTGLRMNIPIGKHSASFLYLRKIMRILIRAKGTFHRQ